jgi:uncharacterized protein YkwD
MMKIRCYRFSVFLVVGWISVGSAGAQAGSAPSGGWHHFGEQNQASPAKASAASARSLAALEKTMYELINRDRTDPENRAETGGRLVPLHWSDQLADAARAHSRDMVARGYFGHVDPDGRSPGLRLRAAGIAWQSVGENIAMNPDVKSAEAAFLNEPAGRQNHRSNILSAKFTEVGVGIAVAPNGDLYITQEFMTPASSLQSAFDNPSH